MSAVLMPLKLKKDPWYKEPWLLLVAGGPAIVVCASIYTGIVAMRGSDKVVAEDYYKQGLMVNKDIQRDARAKELQLAASVALDLTAGRMKIHLTGTEALPDTVQLSLANAVAGASSVNEVIHRLQMRQVTPGNYEGDLKLLSNLASSSVKLFHVKIETSNWRLTGDWFEPEQRAVQLNAAK
ncbi:MAG: FixH family protein [Burkholderiales bacterium]|nr:FixH family protein [Burkholderiales bacterium]